VLGHLNNLDTCSSSLRWKWRARCSPVSRVVQFSSFQIWYLRFGIQVSEFRIQDSGFRIQDSGFRIQDSLQAAWINFQGLGFEVPLRAAWMIDLLGFGIWGRDPKFRSLFDPLGTSLGIRGSHLQRAQAMKCAITTNVWRMRMRQKLTINHLARRVIEEP